MSFICRNHTLIHIKFQLKKPLKPQTEISGILNASLLVDYFLVSFNLLVKSVKNDLKNPDKTPKTEE